MRRLDTAGPLVLLGLMAAGLSPAWAADVADLGRKLKRGVEGQSREAVQEALEGLIEAGGRAAIDPVLDLIPKLGGASATSYWQLVHGASAFADREALQTLGDFLVKKKKAPFARDLLFGLENNSSYLVTHALIPVLEGCPYDMQLMAVDQMAQVKTVESMDALVAALKKEGDRGDPELRRRIMAAMGTITGQSLGDAFNWIGWWEVNRNGGIPEEDAEAKGHGNVLETMNRDRGKKFESLKERPKDRVLVLSSRRPADAPKMPGYDYNYDHMESVLSDLDIPHTVVLKADFEADPDKYLKNAWTILVNCNNIQTQCVCKTCLASKNLAKSVNRMYSCPPNCPDGHDIVSFRLKGEGVKALKSWVDEGGYLFTEDWVLVEIVEEAWGDLVCSTKKTDVPDGADPLTGVGTVRSATVKIQPGRGLTSHPLLRGVFTRQRKAARAPKREGAAGGDGEDGGGDGDDGVDWGGATRSRPGPDGDGSNSAGGPQFQWVIDDESPAIEVAGSGVTVLMCSDELGAMAGGKDAVAVTFRSGRGGGGKKKRRKGPTTGDGGLAGKSRGKGEWAEQLRGGRVLHCLSHFGKQQASRSDTFVLQNLILNFVIESDRNHAD